MDLAYVLGAAIGFALGCAFMALMRDLEADR